jgi:hypothetical protein
MISLCMKINNCIFLNLCKRHMKVELKLIIVSGRDTNTVGSISLHLLESTLSFTLGTLKLELI